MAELNFGILDTQAPGRIAAMPQLAQEKQSQNAMQFMQLQSAVQQNQTAALQFKKLQTDEANLTRFYDEVAKNGGPTNPVDMENQMIGSKVPHYVQLGYTLKQKRLETERSRELYAAANRQPTPAAPPIAPEPGSFGADVAQRDAGITRDNYLVPPPVNRNAFNAAPAQSQTEALRARIDANLALGTDQGNKTAENLQKQLDAIGKRYTVGRTLMGSEGTVYGTAPADPTQLFRLQSELDAMPPNDPRRAVWQTEINKASTAEKQGAERIRIQWGQLGVAQGGLALRNREVDPYGMLPPVMGGGGGGGARQVNNLGTTPPLAIPTPQGAAPTAPAPQAVAPASTAPMTVADAFKKNVTGPEFVAVLPPTVRPLVESILRYDQRPPSLATKRGQQLLELVTQADPTYDAGKAQTRYIAKQTFVKGPVADAIASTNTAIDHMDTLAKYGADLNNADVRLANAAKQGIAAAFGADAPTTFDATRRIVGQEVVKAVVANGGSMREREEAADAFNRANSPAQLAGVIKSYQALLGGRLKSTQLRYENDTGLKDFQTKLLPATIRAISGATPAAAGAGATVSNW